MKLEQLADEVIETDLLIVGGGMAGCMAAIRARQNGNIDVAIMERSSFKFTGEVGPDDFNFGFPFIEQPLPTKEELTRGYWGTKSTGDLSSPEAQLIGLRAIYKVIRVLIEAGVKICEDDGTFKARRMGTRGYGFPPLTSDDKPLIDSIFYRGTDAKEKLAIAALKSGAKAFNRTILTGLITKNGSVVGATGLNTRTGKFLVFKAKTILMSAGWICGMFPYPYAPFPNNLFYGANGLLEHGGGAAAAYRAGAKLVDLEFVGLWVLCAGMSGAFGMSHFWPTRNSAGETLEEAHPELLKASGGGGYPGLLHAYYPNMEAPQIERDVFTCDKSVGDDVVTTASYFSMAGEFLTNLKVCKLLGGVRKGPPIEVKPSFAPFSHHGILGLTDKAETTVKNLFTAGSAASKAGAGYVGSSMGWGLIVGDHVREIAPGVKKPVFKSEQIEQVETEKKRVFAPLGQKGDVDPLELEDYVTRTNMDYAGIHRTGPRLKRAIEILRTIKDKYVPALTASNPHELMRALEVQDIIELSELHAQASLLRTESRHIPFFYRSDYPKQDDKNWQGIHITAQSTAGEARYKRERISIREEV